jgi:hypothetical protein
VIANTICQISLSKLIIEPYSLVLNESMYAKIIAYNVYGDSPYSEPGNGGLVKLVPDAPINIFNDPVITSDIRIRFTWTEGLSNGGIDVYDFSVYYD